jgi:spermidine synthase
MSSNNYIPSRGARPRVVESLEGTAGDLILFRRETPVGTRWEITIGGHFVMAASDGMTERSLARLTLGRVEKPGGIRVLVGGLGLGLTLAEALADPRVGRVVVAELEEAVIRWNKTHLAQFNRGALFDGRVEVSCGDVMDLVKKSRKAFDCVLMDVDNGPSFLILEGNAPLYTSKGLGRVRRALAGGGVLGVWSNQPDDLLSVNLTAAFGNVAVELISDPNLREDLPPTAIYTSVKR